MQLRKKRKKEREALGDKVSLHPLSDNICGMKWPDFKRCFSLEGTTQRGPKDDRKPESLRWDDSWPRRWRGTHDIRLIVCKACQLLFAFYSWTLLLCQVAFDEATDEFSAYFNKLKNPKVLITTSDRPRGVSSFRCKCWDASVCFCLSADISVALMIANKQECALRVLLPWKRYDEPVFSINTQHWCACSHCGFPSSFYFIFLFEWKLEGHFNYLIHAWKDKHNGATIQNLWQSHKITLIFIGRKTKCTSRYNSEALTKFCYNLTLE